MTNILKKHFNNNRTIFVPDNINNWKNKDILEKFYKETEKYAFLIEIKSTCDKINSISVINKQIVFLNKIVINKNRKTKKKKSAQHHLQKVWAFRPEAFFFRPQTPPAPLIKYVCARTLKIVLKSQI